VDSIDALVGWEPSWRAGPMTRAKVERALDDLERMAPEIRDSRRWAKNAAYDRRVRS
jgi:hypothetical protein